MNEYALTLDLAKAKQRQQQTIFVRQGDRNATTIVATITDHGVAASTSGLTARFAMRLPDGTHYYRKAASLSGNVATVALDEAQAASAVGRTDVAYFQLLQGSTVVASTESFTVVVLPDALADAEVAESYDSAIQDAIDALDAAVEQLPSTVEDVLADHPEWTTTVQDGSITKDKMAADLARDRERLLYRLDNLLTNALPDGETATATDAARTPMAALALYGRSTQDGTPTPSAPVPIVSVAPDSHGNISLWARGRNLVNMAYTYPYTRTNSGIAWTVNTDGSVHAEGTATGNSWSHETASAPQVSLPAGTYTVYAVAPDGSVATGFRPRVQLADGTVPAYNNGVRTFTVASDTTATVMLVCNTGTVADADVRVMLAHGSTAAAYEPYEQTVTPIPLDGHELRSLPDGTRDEVTVDQYGHVTLVQRVGHVELDGSSDEVWSQRVPNSGDYLLKGFGGAEFNAIVGVPKARGYPARCTRLARHESGVFSNMPDNAFMLGTSTLSGTTDYLVVRVNAYTTLANFKTWLAESTMTLDYPLATPVTIDLGYVDAVPLCGPDLTAQAVPTTPMQLTYERDLNTTLARLESAIATLA